MSDGPHRSLHMGRGWKRFAERADKNAFAPEEVSDALCWALEQDWRAEIPASLVRKVQTVFQDNQISFFGDKRLQKLEVLKSDAIGYPLANVFLDCTTQAAASAKADEAVLAEATQNALTDWTARRLRQVEEHYHRKSSENRAMNVRGRMQHGVAQVDLSVLAERVLETTKTVSPARRERQAGLDDGVQLK